jgi:hypothetical protein
MAPAGLGTPVSPAQSPDGNGSTITGAIEA